MIESFMYLLSSVPLVSWQSRCTDLLLVITKPSTTKWAYTDSSTLTYAVTRHTMGGILPGKATNLGFLFRIDFDRVEVPLILFTCQVVVTVGISGLCCFVSGNMCDIC